MNEHRRTDTRAEQANLAKFKAAGVEIVTIAVATDSTLGLVKVGESGYYKTDWPVKDYKQAKELAAERNKLAGIAPEFAMAAMLGSAFGWDVPGADPDRHKKEVGR